MSSRAELTSDEDLRELARVGFLAVHVGEPSAARTIFSALVELRPDGVLPHIGRAMAEQAAGRMDDAVQWLRDEALKAHPDSEALQAFLGLALVQANRPSQALPVLRAVVAREGGDDTHVNMAKALLVHLGEVSAVGVS